MQQMMSKIQEHIGQMTPQEMEEHHENMMKQMEEMMTKMEDLQGMMEHQN